MHDFFVTNLHLAPEDSSSIGTGTGGRVGVDSSASAASTVDSAAGADGGPVEGDPLVVPRSGPGRKRKK